MRQVPGGGSDRGHRTILPSQCHGALGIGYDEIRIVGARDMRLWHLTEPYTHFTITDRADIETAVLLMLVGAAVTEVASGGAGNRPVRAASRATSTVY